MKKIILSLIALFILIMVIVFINNLSDSETSIQETLTTPSTSTNSDSLMLKSNFEVLQNSASKGDAKAQNELGNMYANGSGPIQSDNEALKWFEKSANQGYAEAQYNLATMYQNAIGVDQDFKKAVKYYKLAAAQGHTGAKENLEALCEEDSTLCK